jgi:hypothetical protein
MKKNSLFLAAMMLVATSCESEKFEKETAQDLAPVTVRVNDFIVSRDDFSATRATAVGDYANLKALTLAFYAGDGTEVYKHAQFRSDASTYTTFGEFSCDLPMGSYTMVVLGCSSTDAANNISVTSPTSAGFDDFVRETFKATQSVTINSNAALNLTATLDRVIAKVNVVSTDGRTADVHAIRTTFSGGSKSFNPTTGLATDNNGFANTVVTNKAVGSTTDIGTALFLATDDQTMNITIETLDASNNVLFSKTVSNVPLKRNRVTTLTGAMYSASASATSFQVNTDWLTANNVNF